ncbi:unnamed protein product [Caenorhabditis auriculariae]|uniref:N-alpha-acetyltransferase 60 n=1 Tax=Caenorhabditis auriculariae TaxID=2777116 RepID=A0A8S1HSD8_9PELO|nr:unnamed protein product [Caenorhabditis auriculariae]
MTGEVEKGSQRLVTPTLRFSLEIVRPLHDVDIKSLKKLNSRALPILYGDDYWATACDPTKSLYCGFALFKTSSNRLLGSIVLVRDIVELYGIQNMSKKERTLVQSYGKAAYVSTLMVRPSRQRRGYGTLLVQEACVQMKPYAKMIYLHVDVSNEKAIAFYAKCGMTRYARIKNYYFLNDGPQDAYIYMKELI